MGNKFTLEEANSKLQKTFPELTLLSYENSRKLTDVQSSKCGHIWKGSLSNITSKIGGHICRICNPPNNILTLDKARENLNKILPDLELVKFTKSDGEAIVKSKSCGHTWSNKYRNIASKHSGHICRVCNKNPNRILTLEEANERLANINPELLFLSYEGLQKYTDITSIKCNHIWRASLNNLTTGNSPNTCPVCNPTDNKISKGEKEVLEYIKSIYSGWIIENDRVCISPLELDIVIPDKGIAIEYNGIYHHSDNKIRKTSLLDKTKLVREQLDYQLIHIFDLEWETKKDIVKSRINSILGISKRIFARHCEIVLLQQFPSQFLEDNHLQGAGSITSVNLGLIYNSELVAVMTFAKPRFNSGYDYELVRYCSIKFTTIVGGASKLLNYFKNNYPGSIISYSDNRFGIGNMYRKLGFEFIHNSPPNYKYYKNKTLLSRYKCQKHLLKTMFPDIYADYKTELEIMTEAGYVKISDCGNAVWAIK